MAVTIPSWSLAQAACKQQRRRDHTGRMCLTLLLPSPRPGTPGDVRAHPTSHCTVCLQCSWEGEGTAEVGRDQNGEALVTWLEVDESGTHLAVRRLGNDGGLGPALRVAESSASRSSGFPRLAVSGQEVVFAWRDSAEPPRVRTAVLQLP